MDLFSMHGSLYRLPTSTGLARIRHTIDNLKASENLLRERLKEPGWPEKYDEVLRENRRHAIEIAAGWEQLGRLIGELPKSVLDKALFAGEVKNGLDRSGLLIEMAWDRMEPQR